LLGEIKRAFGKNPDHHSSVLSTVIPNHIAHAGEIDYRFDWCIGWPGFPGRLARIRLRRPAIGLAGKLVNMWVNNSKSDSTAPAALAPSGAVAGQRAQDSCEGASMAESIDDYFMVWE